MIVPPWPGMGRLVRIRWGIFLGVTFGVEGEGVTEALSGWCQDCADEH